MSIKIPNEKRKIMLASIKRYCQENLGDEMGDLQAGLLLDFALQEVGACVYNLAISDAQAFFQDKVADLEGSCFEPEFEYWRTKSH